MAASIDGSRPAWTASNRRSDSAAQLSAAAWKTVGSINAAGAARFAEKLRMEPRHPADKRRDRAASAYFRGAFGARGSSPEGRPDRHASLDDHLDDGLVRPSFSGATFGNGCTNGGETLDGGPVSGTVQLRRATGTMNVQPPSARRSVRAADRGGTWQTATGGIPRAIRTQVRGPQDFGSL